MFPALHHFFVDDERLHPLFAALDRVAAAAFVHMGLLKILVYILAGNKQACTSPHIRSIGSNTLHIKAAASQVAKTYNSSTIACILNGGTITIINISAVSSFKLFKIRMLYRFLLK